MIADAIFIQPINKVLRRVAGQSRAAKMRVGGNKIVRPGIQVGEVAASSARDADFFGQFCRMVYQIYRAATSRSMDGAHHARCSGTDDQNVHPVIHGNSLL